MVDLNVSRDLLERAAERANQERRSLTDVINTLLRDYAEGRTWLNLPEAASAAPADPAIPGPGWKFTDSEGNERVKTPYGFNAYVAQDAAVRSARALNHAATWYIWRLADGSFDFSAVPDPVTPGHPAELVETVTPGRSHG